MTDDEILPQPTDEEAQFSRRRLRELLTERALLEKMTRRQDLVIDHNHSGKPAIDGWHISISHTRGWLAIILSDKDAVAVDIEYRSDRILRIVDRFLRKDEQRGDALEMLIMWCAKETAYKLFSEENLDYFEMRVNHFSCANNGVVMLDDLKQPKRLSVSYVANDDYVLTWSVIDGNI